MRNVHGPPAALVMPCTAAATVTLATMVISPCSPSSAALQIIERGCTMDRPYPVSPYAQDALVDRMRRGAG